MSIITTNIDQALSDLLSKYVLSVDVKTFLDTLDVNTGVTNWDKIKRGYSPKELRENEPKYPNGTVLVKQGTQLEMKTSYLKRDLPKQILTEIYRNTEYKPFIASELADLLKDPKYVLNVNGYSGARIATIVNNSLTVYVWCRALSLPGSTSQEGAWINISPFIQDIQTVVSEFGSFSLTLPAISAQYSDSVGWQVSTDLVGYNAGDISDDVLSNTSILKSDPNDPGFYSREKVFFNTIFQQNDLVYIRFEKLSIDEELDNQSNPVTNIVSGSNIPNRIYDMIGLIDTVSISTTPESISVSVSGRDLMKVLIEDGSYFFPAQFAQNIFTDPESILSKRNKIELISQSLAGASYTFKSVSTILKFIFNKFSNIGIVPNEAFSGYGDRATKGKYSLKASSLKKKGNDVINEINDSFLSEERKGVWRIMELVFDPQIANRVLADNSISTDNGSIINSIRKICQAPFIEFFGDTYRDKYYLIVRKQPFDEQGYKGLVYDDFVSEQGASVNASTIIGQDNKLKQSIRKKITDRQLSLTGRAVAISDLVIDIDDVDVLSDPQLAYHMEAYSWYRIVPTGLGILDDNTAFNLAPIVGFDEYAEIWGNKSLEIEYNYAPSEYLRDSQIKANQKYAEQQTFYDLQFLIQSNQYLPFTRTGTIILTGNRTIKKGLFIYFKPTAEIFYVDSVTHTRSIGIGDNNRATILHVSRGMREAYIKGKYVAFPSGNKLVSYFNIINTAVSNDASINNKDFLKNWKVDKDIFNFFIQRRQWVD